MIETSPRKFFHYEYKVHCKKILSGILFSNETHGDAFAAHNAALIDNSLDKNICNDNSSVIFLDRWTHVK